MKIENNSEYSKNYELSIDTEISLDNQNEHLTKKREITLTLKKNTLGFVIKNQEKNMGSLLETKLDELNEVFEEIIFETDENGNLKKLLNYYEIKEKWDKERKKIDMTNQQLSDLVLELNGVVRKKNTCEELLKRFCIFPYFCLGFYNQELKTNIPLTKEMTLYNIYGDEDIEIRFNLLDGTIDEDEKIILLKGKESPSFDRSEFVKKIHSSYPNVPVYKIGGLEIKCEGKFIFSKEDIFKHMEFILDIEAKNLYRNKMKIIIEPLGEKE